MIDDDSFDNIVRRMFEQFFGNTFRINPYDSKAQIEFNRGKSPVSEVKEEEPFIDVIELENEILIVLATNDRIQNPQASITEGLLRFKENPSKATWTEISLPSPVDIENSEMTYSNGIVEMKLAITEGPQEEGLLTITK